MAGHGAGVKRANVNATGCEIFNIFIFFDLVTRPMHGVEFHTKRFQNSAEDGEKKCLLNRTGVLDTNLRFPLPTMLVQVA